VQKVWKKVSLQFGIVMLSMVTLGAFLVSSLSPGNELRIAMAVEHNMPQFENLSLAERFFILVQWLVSSFANENAVFLMAIWVAGIGILGLKLKNGRLNKNQVLRVKGYLVGSTVFTVVALAGRCGVRSVSDIGIYLAEMTGLVERVPVASDMSSGQWSALAWWLVAMAFTLFFLWEVSEKKWLVLFTYMGAVASEVILIFSPTIYSSGERVFFIAGLMLMFIILLLYEQLPKGKIRVGYVITLLSLGVFNLGLQAVELLAMMMG
ncbi:MAG: hypothetical protein IKU69_06125, partial [Roseburia sp.]|nr:hypothetical protein [Roseburia sp.]